MKYCLQKIKEKDKSIDEKINFLEKYVKLQTDRVEQLNKKISKLVFVNKTLKKFTCKRVDDEISQTFGEFYFSKFLNKLKLIGTNYIGI